MQNERGQGVSHATGDSKVPDAVQRNAPQGLEESLPEKVHDTSNLGTQEKKNISHATGDSKVPQKLQEAVPLGIEKALPNSIHDTSGLQK